MGEYDDYRSFLREAKQEAIEKRRAERRRDHQRRMRPVNKAMHSTEDVVFRSLRFVVNNVGPNGKSSGRKTW